MSKLDKAEGVKDCVEFIEKRIKELNKSIRESNFFDHSNVEARDELVSIKISLEKYSKKLKHEHKEEEEEYEW